MKTEFSRGDLELAELETQIVELEFNIGHEKASTFKYAGDIGPDNSSDFSYAGDISFDNASKFKYVG